MTKKCNVNKRDSRQIDVNITEPFLSDQIRGKWLYFQGIVEVLEDRIGMIHSQENQ